MDIEGAKITGVDILMLGLINIAQLKNSKIESYNVQLNLAKELNPALT